MTITSLLAGLINESEPKIWNEFKIIHLKSKTNRDEIFNAAEELYDLTKNDSATSGNEKKRTRTIFGSDSKSVEEYNGQDGKWFRTKTKFLHKIPFTNKKKFLRRELRNDIVRRIAVP